MMRRLGGNMLARGIRVMQKLRIRRYAGHMTCAGRTGS